jgi:hypothetical protein
MQTGIHDWLSKITSVYNLVFRFQVGLANVVILESHGAPISTAIRPCPQNACLWILLDDLGTTKSTSVMA